MKTIYKIIVIILAVASFSGCSEEGTIGLVEYGDITGKVVTKETFEPIVNAKVTLSPGNNTTLTNSEGKFKFTNVETKEYSVKAEKEGYLNKFEGATVVKDQTVNVIIEMEISTANNRAPSKPELASPADNTDDVESQVELSWSATDPDGDTLKYRIVIKNDANSDVLEINDYTEKTYTLTNLKYDTKYFWQIAVTDDINPEVLSETFTFTTKEYPNNRYFYVGEENGNNIIYSADYDESNSSPINVFKLTNNSQNSWRPRKNNTADLIAFLKTENNETHIFTMKPNGTDVTKVTSAVPVNAFDLNEVDFSWSSDGNKLLYPSFDKLYSINKDGTGLQMVYQTTDGNLITECDWSDDGSKIAIKTNDSSGYNVKIHMIDTSGNTLATPLAGVNGAAGGLNLSASGNKLLYTRDVSGFESTTYRQLDNRMFVYDFGTGIATDLSENKVSGTNDLDPRFSPNEAEIIFVNTSNDGISERNIWRTQVEGSNSNNRDRKKLFQNSIMPDWE